MPSADPAGRAAANATGRSAPGPASRRAADLDQPELADVIAALRRAMRRAARADGPGGELPGGLSVAQLELLSAVADNPGARPGQLARLLRLAPSSVATLVNGLRAAGLITRTGGDRDRRTALLLLTPHGTTVVGSWQQLNERILRAAISALTPDSAAALDAAVPALAAVDALADGRLE